GRTTQFGSERHGGTGAIWRALADRLTRRHPARLEFGARIASIDSAGRRATLADGRTIRYRRLLSTTALDDFVRASDLASDLAPALEGLEYSSTHVIGI